MGRNMDLSAILERIRYHENAISDCYGKNRDLQENLQKLEIAKAEYLKKESSFDSYRLRKQSNASNAMEASDIRIAKSYSELLSNACGDSKSSTVAQAFSGISSSIDRQRRHFEDDISDNERLIRIHQDETTYLRQKLNKLSLL